MFWEDPSRWRDEDIRTWDRKRLAKVIGYVPQAHTPPFPYTVEEVVLMGRTAHIGSFFFSFGQ